MRTAANTVRKGAPSKLFAHAYPVIVEFMRVDYIPFTAPFDADVAVYEVAAILKDNVRVETSTQLAETHEDCNRRLNPVRALAIATLTTIFGVDRLQKAIAARPPVRCAILMLS